MDDAEHSARLECVMAGARVGQSKPERGANVIVQEQRDLRADQMDVHVDVLIGVVIAALTLTQIVVSGRRIRRSIGEQDRL